MLNQLIALIGAVAVLGAYLGIQRKWLRPEDRNYHILNFVGAGLLTYIAVIDQRWGFILLEGVWALAALLGLLRPAAAEAR